LKEKLSDLLSVSGFLGFLDIFSLGAPLSGSRLLALRNISARQSFEYVSFYVSDSSSNLVKYGARFRVIYNKVSPFVHMRVFFSDKPRYRVPAPARSLSRKALHMPFLADVLDPKRYKFAFRPHLNSIKSSSAPYSRLCSRSALGLGKGVLPMAHALPLCLGFSYVFYRRSFLF
jgi:hypothetical protein